MATKHVNEVKLIGNVGKDAEVTYAQTGTARAKFTLATNQFKKGGNEGYGWQDSGNGWLKKTSWHNIIAWGDLAESLTDLEKGTLVEIIGNIDYQSWEDKQTGDKKYMTVINAREVTELEDEDRAERKSSNRSDSRKAEPRKGTAAPRRAGAGTATAEITDEDIPF